MTIGGAEKAGAALTKHTLTRFIDRFADRLFALVARIHPHHSASVTVGVYGTGVSARGQRRNAAAEFPSQKVASSPLTR